MSESENLDTDLTSYSLDDEDQLPPEDTLTGTGQESDPDALDTGYSPPDSARGSLAHGTTADEQADPETLQERIRQEEPEPEPSSESSGDEDWGDGDVDEIGDERAGRLVAGDQEGEPEQDLLGRDVGIDGGAASAEEAAVHVVDGDDGDEGERP